MAEPRILVEIVEALGSAPRPDGTWMLVGEQGIERTIGGGALEHRAIARARDMLAENDPTPREIELPLGPALSQCCGGYVRLRLSPSPDPRMLAERRRMEMAGWPEVRLFGAGHVGRAIVAAMADLPVRIVWIDGRADQFPLTLGENVEKILTEDAVAVLADTPLDSAILVMTHEHARDLAIVEAALQHGHRGFLGLIGSATKRARFERHLRSRGLDTARLTCPIGLSAIRGKEPAVIAASVTAQLLMLFEAQAGALEP